MNFKIKYYLIFLCVVFFSCTNTMSVKNEKKGKLTANYQLVASNEKRILLDYETAPQPPYMQMIEGYSGKQILTLLNPYKNAIYFYDYENAVFTGKVEYEKEGPNGIIRLAGYYIENMDSIYVFCWSTRQLVLTDSTGLVKQRISLIDNREITSDWAYYYPQYEFTMVNPLIKKQGKIILPGMQPVKITDSLIHQFKFTSCVDMKTGKVEFMHTYPYELYGSNTQWESPWYMQPYQALLPTGEFVFSFPISHNVYIVSYDATDYKTVYAGSNVAGTIRSIDDSRRRIPVDIIRSHFLRHDIYAAILHDPYRHLYYRYMLQANPAATTNTHWKEKQVVVIIMDEHFEYLGETAIGTCEKWNWGNSFVTSEGLTMEYIDQDADPEEQYIILKTFTVEKINK